MTLENTILRFRAEASDHPVVAYIENQTLNTSAENCKSILELDLEPNVGKLLNQDVADRRTCHPFLHDQIPTHYKTILHPITFYQTARNSQRFHNS
jgi:hypothetical protein